MTASIIAQDEYVRREGDKVITTNTVEGYYSIFKRGMKGVYQHCSEKHLHRYLAEFDFRYSNRVALGVDDSEPCNSRAARRGREAADLSGTSFDRNPVIGVLGSSYCPSGLQPAGNQSEKILDKRDSQGTRESLYLIRDPYLAKVPSGISLTRIAKTCGSQFF